MATYTVAHAAQHIEEIIAKAERSGEVMLTRDERPVPKLTAVEQLQPRSKRRFGRYKGIFTIADSFDEPVWTDEDYEAWLSKP